MKYQPKTALEKIICPIVEGQIRHFLHEHPEVLKNVDWYKGRKHSRDPVSVFTNSLAKRINRDLTSATVRARLAQALLESKTGAP